MWKRTLLVSLALSAAVMAAPNWAGDYQFEEVGARNSGQAWFYKLHLGADGTGKLDIDGFQCMQRLDVKAEPKGDDLVVSLVGYRGAQRKFAVPGAKLFTFDHQDGKLHTSWQNLQPQLADSHGSFVKKK